jgi:DNA-binding transcriptional MerR regulator
MPNDVRYPWEEPENDAAASARPSDHGQVSGGEAQRTEADAAAEPSFDALPTETTVSDDLHTDRGAAASRSEDDVAEAAVEEASPASGTTRERPIAPKEYYAISEVCDLVDLKPHVLRYWETQFGVLNPSKNRSGNRVYQRKEIKLILLVKHLLYEEKYTVEGAKQKLEQLRRTGDLGPTTARALDAGAIQMLRTELRALSAILTVPEGTDANPGHQR